MELNMCDVCRHNQVKTIDRLLLGRASLALDATRQTLKINLPPAASIFPDSPAPTGQKTVGTP